MSRPSPQTSRVIALLELLAADPGTSLSLAEVSRRLGVHRASCHSMLQTLAAAGWLLRDPARKTYQLGPALVPIGKSAAERFPALEFARPAMVALARDTESHCVALLTDGDHLTVVDQVRAGPGGTPMPIGTEMPLRPPYGIAVATWGSDEQEEDWLAQVPDDTRDADRQAIADSRRRGYTVGLRTFSDERLQELAHLLRASDTGQEPSPDLQRLARELSDELLHRSEWFAGTLDEHAVHEVSHIFAPVFDHGGKLVLLVGLVPVHRTMTGAQVDAIGQQLVSATGTVTRALGGIVPGALRHDRTGA